MSDERGVAMAGPGSDVTLRPSAIGLREILFQSITHMAPGVGVAFAIIVGAYFAGGALPLAVLGNVVRLSLIIVAAEAFGQSAGNYVHGSFWFSLLPYAPAFITLALLGHWLRKGALHPAQPLEVKAT